MKSKDWSVYIVECRDGKLYTGISNDVEKRVKTHNKGRGCRFTKYRYPVEFQYQEYCGTRALAMRREAQIKSLSRAEKLDLIEARAL